MKEAFLQSSQNRICWSLSQIPTVGFYRELHNYFRKWPPSRSVTKTAVGKFYISIDPELQRKSISSRPDNIFQFIQKIASSDKSHTAPMSYGLHATVDHLQTELSECSDEIQGLSAEVKKRDQELSAMKREVEIAKTELSDTRCALQDITNKLYIAGKQRDCARKQADKCLHKLEATIADFMHYEELLGEKDELSDLVSSLQQEISSLSSSDINDQLAFCFQTKKGGKVYSPAIRDLYYTLLASQ